MRTQFRRNPPRKCLADGLSYFHRIEDRGSGFRRMRDQMLDHDLDRPVIGTDMGYFQIMLPGPIEDVERLRVPDSRLLVTLAVEAHLTERQRSMARKSASLPQEGHRMFYAPRVQPS